MAKLGGVFFLSKEWNLSSLLFIVVEIMQSLFENPAWCSISENIYLMYFVDMY